MQVRFLDGVRNAALAALPSRWWQEVIEMPILLTAAFSFTKLLLIRCGIVHATCEAGPLVFKCACLAVH